MQLLWGRMGGVGKATLIGNLRKCCILGYQLFRVGSLKPRIRNLGTKLDNSQLHASNTLTSGKISLHQLGKEAGWASEPVLVLPWYRTTIPRTSNP